MTSQRLTFEEYGCLIALSGACRSEDPFTKVGAAAFDFSNRCIGIAYNGLKSGMKLPEWMLEEENRVKKGSFFIHAEQNLFALLKKGECKTVCLTLSPCDRCCQTIVALDIKKVIYLKEYHGCDKFKEIFDFHGVEYAKLSSESISKIKDSVKTMVEIQI